MPAEPLIIDTDRGLFCSAGDFYVDAWQAVPRNVVTHAHADHARRGSGRYLAAADGARVLQYRMGADAIIDPLEYGQTIDLHGVKVSLHPAGHVLGSAQVRVEHRGEVWVISGDYKRQPDPTCRPFEIVRCNTFITECTFGLPIFRWPSPVAVADDINAWWRGNCGVGRTSLLLAYSLGKAQRVLAGLDADIGPILLHGAAYALTEAYRESGIALPPAEHASAENAKLHRGRALVIAPPSAMNSTWARKFAPISTGVASGWMRVRGFRRRRAADRGFVLSDHVDFPALLETIEQTGAQHVIATHGYTDALVRLLSERGRRASAFATRFGGEEEETDAPTPESPHPVPEAPDPRLTSLGEPSDIAEGDPA
jgi:putative mRNA 3-end processing factor